VIYPSDDGYCYDWSSPPDSVADYCIRSASYSAVGNYLNGGPVRAFMEFPVSGEVEYAKMCVDFYRSIWSGNAHDVLADEYVGNGLVETADFGGGALIGVVYTAYSPYGEYCVNVTDAFNQAQGYLGIRLHWSSEDEHEGGASGHPNYWYTRQMESSNPPYILAYR
jgi:hypothetical protein